MWRLVIAVLLAGCAQLAGIEKTTGAPEDAIVVDVADAAPVDDAVDAPIDSPPDARPCEGGAARVSDPATGTCYVLFTSPMTRNAARTACLGLGAELAKVDSAEVQALLATLIGTSVAFIGASDEAVEGTFVWEDGSPMTFTSWNTGEPNNGGGFLQEDCVVMLGSAGGAWDDRPCAPVPIAPAVGSYPFVCASP